MQRYVTQKLKEWIVSTSRKPAVLRGARQVGKTVINTPATITTHQFNYLFFF